MKILLSAVALVFLSAAVIMIGRYVYVMLRIVHKLESLSARPDHAWMIFPIFLGAFMVAADCAIVLWTVKKYKLAQKEHYK